MASESEDFAAAWSAQISRVVSSDQAARLPTTIQAAIRAWDRFATGAAALVADATRVASTVVERTERLIRELSPQVGRSLLAVAQVAAVTYAEGLNSEYRRADLALRRGGWWALSSWTDKDLARNASLATAMGRRAFDRALCERYRAQNGRELRRLANGWWDEEAFRLRRLIMRDAVEDHLAGRFRVSIPTLLPCLEGVVADAFALGARSRVPEGLESELDLVQGFDALEVEVALAALLSLYGAVDFSTVSPLSPRLNRHLILHGRTVRYGTEANSLKVILHLDQLRTQIATKRRLDAAQNVPLEARPIRVANALVQQLGVPEDVIRAAREFHAARKRPATGASRG